MDFLLLIVVIFVCTLIQSLFGIGILVFGTPTLILLGYPFQEVLLFLLPCSIIVSSFQVFEGWAQLKSEKSTFLVYIIPPLLIGLFLVLYLDTKYNVTLFVGILLVISGLLRTSARLKSATAFYLKKHSKIFLAMLGLVHGTTNLGGSFLTIYCATKHHKKIETRNSIAFGYLLMASAQFLLLLSIGSVSPSYQVGILPLVACITYKLLGRKIFRHSSEKVYQALISVFILTFGIVLILSAY